MELTKAISKGRPFKRKGWPYSYRAIRADGPFECVQNGEEFVLTPEDALAADWEVEEMKIELTWDQVREAISAREGDIHHDNGGCVILDYFYHAVKKKLGFRD